MPRRSTRYGKELHAMFDAWHSIREPRDNKLDALIHSQYAEILEKGTSIDFGVPYFSPSSANSCPRELYEKIKGAPKTEEDGTQPHRGRWTRIGTAFGDVLQRDLLFIEKHYEATFGEPPPFTPERTPAGYPAWEDFIMEQVVVEHNGQRFSLLGTSDGILRHRDGTRIGFEVKSKQTTAAQTSEYSMRAPKDDHLKQMTAYAIMYDLDRYIIAYGNLSKKSWFMSEEDYKKTPDFRIFEVTITDDMKTELLDFFADIMRRVAENDPPPLDVTKWTFNGYKDACAVGLTDAELAVVKQDVRDIMAATHLPQFMKNSAYDAYQDILERREKAKAHG